MKFLVMPVRLKIFSDIHAESCTGIYCNGLKIGGGCPVLLGCYMM